MSNDSSNASPAATDTNRGADRRLTREQFNRQLWHAIIPPLLLLAAHAALITLLFMYFLRASDLSRHTEQVMGNLTDVERLLVNMETAFRGYQLVGDEQFLEPYRKAKPRFDPALVRLEKLVGDNPAQLRRLADLRKTYQRWLDSESQMLTPPPKGSISEDYRNVLIQRNGLSNSMRENLREMSMVERELQTSRDQRESRAAVTALLGGIGMSLLLGVALALVNRRTVVRLSGEYQQVIDEAAVNSKQFIDLAETIPQLIWISDGDGKPVYFNQPWVEFTGAASIDLQSPGWRTALHEEDTSQVESKWNHSLQTGAPFEGEYRLKRGKDGTFRWFLCRAIPVAGPDGKRTRWFGSCTDIENQKQLQRDRDSLLAAERAARSDLLRHGRAKDEFLATLSHELRTPMTAIMGWTRLLRDPKIRDQHLDRAIEAIDSGARAQSRLIDDLLDMSRITSGKLVLKVESMDLRQVVSASIDSVSPAAANKQISLFVSIPQSQEFGINGDPARLQQVVWNLLNNAVKFTPAGGKVSIALQRDLQAARIIVADTGRGIDPAFLPHVFQRFRQADGSTTRQHGGLGLGLAIVEHLVEMHGGTVTAASDGPGHGATFTVELPLHGTPSAVQPAEEPRAPSRSLAEKRVLIVDDDAGTVNMLKVLLESANCTVTAVNTAREALNALRAQRFDALISDIGMPDIDGYTLMRRLRETESPDRPAPPAIALSAFARAEDRAAALEAGYQLHVAKPASPEELLTALHTLLGEARSA